MSISQTYLDKLLSKLHIMNLIRGLVTILIALFMIKLFIDLVMFLFVSNVISRNQIKHGNLRGL